MLKPPVTLLLATIILGLAVGWRLSSQSVQTLPKKQEIKLLTTLKREPKIYGRTQILEIGDSRFYADLFPRYHVGDRLSIEGIIDETGRANNAKVELVGRENGLATRLAALRVKVAQNIKKLLPDREATLLSGTVLGVDEIGSDFREELIKTGTIHVVVVSGQNLMIVAGVFLSLARYVGRRQSLILAVFAVSFYALLTGFEPPVVRASIMVIIGALSIYKGRESLPLWNLALAALLIVLIWPQALFEVSFQLTFAATLGIMTLGSFLRKIAQGPVSRFPPASAQSSQPSQSSKSSKPEALRAVGSPSSPATLRNYLAWLLKDIFWGNAAIATSAYIFTAPIILFYFGRISLVAPVANILVAEAVFPIMILGFLAAISSLIFLPLAQALAFLAYVPAFYFVKVVEILSLGPTV